MTYTEDQAASLIANRHRVRIKFPAFGWRVTQRMAALRLKPEDVAQRLWGNDRPGAWEYMVRLYMEGRGRPAYGAAPFRDLARALQWTDDELETKETKQGWNADER